ncbi:MAG: 6-pyruvoyl trahydropterin synthase family protein, partial [bacterium]
MKLGYIEHIDCAHFLPGHRKCGVLHGHTYKVEVIIEGENKTGMILDFGEMKLIIRGVLA